jgi:phosphoglycerate transport regulatory protein PgtC
MPKLISPVKTVAVGVALALSFSLPVRAEDVVVLSSYPGEMTNRYERAFEQANPGIDLKLLWQQGRESMATLRKSDQSGVDVYWSPALSNFPALAREGAFQPITGPTSKPRALIGAQRPWGIGSDHRRH